MKPLSEAKTGHNTGPYIIEVQKELRAVRNLRDGLAGLVYQLVAHRDKKGLLILSDPKITPERLNTEWRHAQHAFKSDVMKRLRLVLLKDGQFLGLPDDFGQEDQNRLFQRIGDMPRRKARASSPPNSYYVVLETLLQQWLHDRGPMTVAWLRNVTGYSYPTVAEALNRLSHHIKRYSGRRVGLEHFPREEWGGLAAVSSLFRSTVLFIDRSGQPRSPEELLRRLRRLERADVAVGGVHEALHHFPGMDLTGSPRLDVSVHCPHGDFNLDFVKRLDPGLERTREILQPVALAVHAVRRKDPLFEAAPDGLTYAGPVECLLDLHEASLEPQAEELLHMFMARRKEPL